MHDHNNKVLHTINPAVQLYAMYDKSPLLKSQAELMLKMCICSSGYNVQDFTGLVRAKCDLSTV